MTSSRATLPERAGRAEIVELHLRVAADNRRSIEILIRRVEQATRELREKAPMPLDLLSRYERALTAAHAHNLLRLDYFSDAELRDAEVQR